MSKSSQNAKTSGDDIAVIGMAGFFPDSPDLHSFWRNIVKGKISIREIPPERWDWRHYYHHDTWKTDAINSKWGAFLPDIIFDPLRYGIPPKSLNHIETAQLLMLECTRMALSDAGYLDRGVDHNRTSVFIGTGAGEGDLGQHYSFRSLFPKFFGKSAADVLSGFSGMIPEWGEDSFTGVIMNITAGRIANRFNLKGANATVDAACASVLAALRTGILELKSKESDMVIVGGADTLMSPYAYTCFSKIGALSGTGRSIPFDEKADGIVLGEAIGAVIIKRLADAEKDGDHVYAVIKGIGASSDGRGKALTLPSPEGQVMAFSRAYENADIDPATVELIEAHGTSTVAGDRSEAAALRSFFSRAGMPGKSCGVGSVKSMIGHAKCAAGIASLIKAVLALYYKTLPPTAGIRKPIPDLDGENNPLYLNARARSWFAPDSHPRRAGVNAFGFGGVNFHAVLEEYNGKTDQRESLSSLAEWDTELLIFTGSSTTEVSARLQSIEDLSWSSPGSFLKDLAYTLAMKKSAGNSVRLAIVASSADDLKKKLRIARAMLSGDKKEARETSGVFFSRIPRAEAGKIAFVYPGQGSQYTGMLNDLCLAFPLVRKVFERFDSHLRELFPSGLSRLIHPPVSFSETEKKKNGEVLTRTNVAQAAMGVVDAAMFELLTFLGAAPDMFAGHSYGEYPALFSAGVFGEEALALISEARGRFILESAAPEPGIMAAVKATEDDVVPLLQDIDGVWIANLNSPVQTVISGTRSGVRAAMHRLKEKEIASKEIPVSCAFHSPIVDGARSRLNACLDEFDLRTPRLPVYSNTTATCFPMDGHDLRQLLVQQLISPVRFTDEIEAMYAAGARIFVEVGAGSVLTNLIGTILEGKPHQAVATNKKGLSDLTGLQHALAVLAVSGCDLKLERLYTGRSCSLIDMENLKAEAAFPPSRTAYIIGNGKIRPANQPGPQTVIPRPICFKDAPVKAPAENISNAGGFYDKVNSFQSDGEAMASLHNQQKQSTIMGIQTNQAAVDDTVIVRFQDLMSQFLDTQKAVMTAYLRGLGAAPDLQPPQEIQTYERLSTMETTLPEAALQVMDGLAGVMGKAMEKPAVQLAGTPDFQQPPDMPHASEKSITAPDKKENTIDLKTIILNIVSECTGYPVDMLEPNQEIEADLGIDSIKRMQVMEELETALHKINIKVPENKTERLIESLTLEDLINNLREAVGNTRAPAAENRPSTFDTLEAQTPAGLTSSLDIAAMLMDVVSDLSGYPTDMLEPNQEIEADLGIDSIKRMEILTYFESKLEKFHVTLSDADREKLAESVTLNDIVVGLETAIKKTAATMEHQSNSKTAQMVLPGEKEAVGDDSALPDATALSRQAIDRRLHQIVEKHTGYPAETLEPDMKLQADLNMDSAVTEQVVKDLITALDTDIPGLGAAAGRQLPDKPACLGDLTDWMVHVLRSTPTGKGRSGQNAAEKEISGSSSAGERLVSGETAPIRRFSLQAKERELIMSPENLSGDKTILVTVIPGDPLAAAVVSRLESLDRKVVVLRHQAASDAVDNKGNETNRYEVDFKNFDRLAVIVNDIRQAHGPISALLHLTSLASGRKVLPPDLEVWKSETAVIVKSLFCLTKLLTEDLTAAPDGAAAIVAATSMGGTFASIAAASQSDKPEFSPIAGGVCGFLKSLAEEMPGINMRVVDNDPKDTPETIATQITNELLTPSTDIEVGYQSGIRQVLDIVESPLEPKERPEIPIDADSRLLITGGARGITSAVALEMARRFQPIMLLVGRTPLVEKESTQTAGIEDEKQLKAVLAKELRSREEKIRPMDLENAYNRLMAQREIRDTLKKLRETGAQASYLQADVTDAEGFSGLIESIYEKYGRIDGVIHGAGRIEDKMVKDKDAESFDRVFDTKADSLFVLAKALRPGTLRFLALFSSVAGRFGNAGQTDYGAANEVYSKTALYLNKCWPGRVISFIWGPWESRGMVSEGLRQKFNAAGISLIPRDTGANLFVDEILYGPKAATEVVYSGWDDRKKALTPASRTAGLPLLSYNSNFYPSRDGDLEVVRRLDIHYDHYLQDHKLDGHPVLPMAMAMEIMAEAAAYRYPDYYLKTFDNFHVLKGIVLNNGLEYINIAINPEVKNDERIRLNLRIRDGRNKNRLYYRADAELVRGRPAPCPHTSLELNESSPFLLSVTEAYEKHLFHGPLWQGIQHVETIGKDGIIGRLKTSRPDSYLGRAADCGDSDWLIDPLVIDSGLQLVALWMRNQMNATPLPTKFGKYTRFDVPENGGHMRCEVHVQVPENGGLKSADLFFTTSDGILAGIMEGLDIIGSQSLNRLTEKQ